MLDNALFHPRSPGTPLQSWIRQSLVNAILDGKLQQGQRMPATRHLAKSLSVGRNTVTAAPRALAIWIAARPMLPPAPLMSRCSPLLSRPRLRK